MDANLLSLAGTPGPAVTSTKRDAVASPAVSGVASPLRWRFALTSQWERKVDEVNVLAGACQGVSPAGDDLPGDGATSPSFRLYLRAARAYEELAAIADAIERLDTGTYGACADCGQPMADEWLARDPATRWCASCAMPGVHSAGLDADVVRISSGHCRSSCTTGWPASAQPDRHRAD